MPPLDGINAVAQLGPADPREAARQGRADRFLDLLLHQLPALDPLCPGLGRTLSRRRAGRDRRPRARIRVRARRRQRPRRGRRSRHPLSGRDRQRLSRSGGRSTTASGPPITSSMPRGASATTISARAITTCRSGSSASCSPKRAGRRRSGGAGPGRGGGRRRAGGAADAALARNLSRLRPRRQFRLARRPGARPQPPSIAPAPLALNQWSLAGNWTVGRQHARLDRRRRADRLPLPRPRPPSRARQRPAGRCASGSRSTAGRPAPRREWTWTPGATAW